MEERTCAQKMKNETSHDERPTIYMDRRLLKERKKERIRITADNDL